MKNPFITYYDAHKSISILQNIRFNSDEERKAFESIRHNLFEGNIMAEFVLDLSKLLNDGKNEEAKSMLEDFIKQNYMYSNVNRYGLL